MPTQLNDRYQAVTAQSLQLVSDLSQARVDVLASPALANVEIVSYPPPPKNASRRPADVDVHFTTTGPLAKIEQLREASFRTGRDAQIQLLDLVALNGRHLEWADKAAGTADLAAYLNTLLHKPNRFASPILFRLLVGGPFKKEEHSGVLRAVLSSSYGAIDACDLADTVLGEVGTRGAELFGAWCSEYGERFKVCMIYPHDTFKINADGTISTPPAGWRPSTEDRVGVAGHEFLNDKGWNVPAVVLSLGETGSGAVNACVGVVHTHCRNLFTSWKVMGKIHRIQRAASEGMAWTDDTRQKQLAAALAECKDAIADCIKPSSIEELKFKLAAAQNVTLKTEKALELAASIIKASDAKSALTALLNLVKGQVSATTTTRREVAEVLNSREAAALFTDENVLQDVAGQVMFA